MAPVRCTSLASFDPASGLLITLVKPLETMLFDHDHVRSFAYRDWRRVSHSIRAEHLILDAKQATCGENHGKSHSKTCVSNLIQSFSESASPMGL